MTNKILLVDDHKIIRDGLKSLLEKERDFEVIAQAENGIEAIRDYLQTKSVWISTASDVPNPFVMR